MLKNEAIIVTGGAKRIGHEIAIHLAKMGYEIILHANNSLFGAQETAKKIEELGVKCSIILGDLLDMNFTENFFEKLVELTDTPIVGLINNASIFENDSADCFTSDAWDMHFAINAKVPCILASGLKKYLGNNKGFVVNLLDQRVFKLNPYFFTYTLSKMALYSATKTMAQSFAPNIRVNGIAPGPTIANVRQSKADFDRQVSATLLENGSPPTEIAKAVGFLCEAEHITGQIIAVDGGQSLMWQTPDVEGIKE